MLPSLHSGIAGSRGAPDRPALGPHRRCSQTLPACFTGLPLIYNDRPRSLVLFGPTRVGKTIWARDLGSHIYFCGLYSYAEAIKACDADYAIFDDIQGGIKFFPAYKNWLGAQAMFQIKGLYRDPQMLRWGKPCIWISNTDPRTDMALADIDWLEGNCTIIEVTNNLIEIYFSCQ